MSFVISLVVSRESFITLHCFNVSPAAKLRAMCVHYSRLMIRYPLSNATLRAAIALAPSLLTMSAKFVN